jgi:hypothetical protein
VRRARQRLWLRALGGLRGHVWAYLLALASSVVCKFNEVFVTPVLIQVMEDSKNDSL